MCIRDSSRRAFQTVIVHSTGIKVCFVTYYATQAKYKNGFPKQWVSPDLRFSVCYRGCCYYCDLSFIVKWLQWITVCGILQLAILVLLVLIWWHLLFIIIQFVGQWSTWRIVVHECPCLFINTAIKVKLNAFSVFHYSVSSVPVRPSWQYVERVGTSQDYRDKQRDVYKRQD